MKLLYKIDYVLDASSIFEAYENHIQYILYNNVTSSYSLIELGNIIYKHSKLLKRISEQEAMKYMEDFYNIISRMFVYEQHRVEEFLDILNISLKFNITFYDASYVYLAYILDLPLITEDKKLREKVKDFIQTFSLKDILE